MDLLRDNQEYDKIIYCFQVEQIKFILVQLIDI